MFIVIIVGQSNLMRIFMLVKLSINSQCWIQPRVLPAMLMVKLYSKREMDRGELPCCEPRRWIYLETGAKPVV